MVDLVIPVSTGKSSTPTPIFISKFHTKYRSTIIYERTYTVPRVPFTMCVSVSEAICFNAALWQENAGQPFGVHRSYVFVRMPINHARWLFQNTSKGTPITIPA